MGKRQKSTANRPAQRPVLQFRVHPDLREKIRKSARDLKISISEEAERRLDQSFKQQDAAEQISRLNEMLIAFRDRDRITGPLFAGWLADQLRSHDVEEAIIKELVDTVRAYFGTKHSQEGTE